MIGPKKLAKDVLAALAKHDAGSSIAKVARETGISRHVLDRAKKSRADQKSRDTETRGVPKTRAVPKKSAKKRGRPKTSRDKLDAAIAAYGAGDSVEDAAEKAGTTERVLYRELRRLGLETDSQAVDASAEVAQGALPTLDHDASSVEIARQGIKHAIRVLRDMTPAHRSFVTQQQVVQRWLDKVRRWEREEAKRETPEEVATRQRREAGLVVATIEQHVSAYEEESRAEGNCLWCGHDLDEVEHE